MNHQFLITQVGPKKQHLFKYLQTIPKKIVRKSKKLLGKLINIVNLKILIYDFISQGFVQRVGSEPDPESFYRTINRSLNGLKIEE